MKDKTNKSSKPVVRGKFAKAPWGPHTGRLYSRELWERCLQRFLPPGAPKSDEETPTEEGSP